MDIGNKIRELRTRKGLTLEELASRSELTKGFLSQLERDLTSPSIDSLSDILEALGTNLAEFFQEDKNDQFIFHADDFFVDEREDCTVNWIVPNTQKNQMEPILLELPEGGESFTVEPHDGEEFGYVVEGSVVLVCDGEEHPLPEDFCAQGGVLAYSLPDEHPHATTAHRQFSYVEPTQGGILLERGDTPRKYTVYAIGTDGRMIVGDVTV